MILPASWSSAFCKMVHEMNSMYAYDFIIIDEEGNSFSGSRTNPEDYYCYGKEILAPADGVVVEAKDGYPDSMILENGEANCAARDIRGNYILIRHAEREYGLLLI